MKRLLIAEQWDQFARAVLPPNCSVIQRQEMRRAFYAGAQGVLLGCVAALAPEGEPTAEDLQMMQNVHDELSEFAQLVADNRA
jgi:biotin synthase-like enzyme